MLAIASLIKPPTSSKDIPSGMPSIASCINSRTSSVVAPSGITIPAMASLIIPRTSSVVAKPNYLQCFLRRFLISFRETQYLL